MRLVSLIFLSLLLHHFASAQTRTVYDTMDNNFRFQVALDSVSPEYMEWYAKAIVVTSRHDSTKVQTINLDMKFAYFGKEDLIVGDMDFDGYNDFRIREHPIGMHGNSSCRYFMYNPVTMQFVQNDSLYADLMSPVFDPEAKTITEGGYSPPGSWGSTTYKVTNHKLVPVSFTGEENDDETAPERLTRRYDGEYINGKAVTTSEERYAYDAKKKVYIYTERQLENGKLVVTYRKVLGKSPYVPIR